jgi:uncharacterized protein (TIGR02996 family)
VVAQVTEAELRAEIARHPDDDAPRRIFADWLIERDDPRGELIQLDFTIPRLEGDQRIAAVRRRAELVCAHFPTWTPYPKQRFARGFLEEIEVDRRVARGPIELVRVAHVRRPEWLRWLDDVETIEELRLAVTTELIGALAERRPKRLRVLALAEMALTEPLPAKLLVGLERVHLDGTIVLDQARAALEAAAPSLREVHAADREIRRWALARGIAPKDYLAPPALARLSFAGDRTSDVQILTAAMARLAPAAPRPVPMPIAGNPVAPFRPGETEGSLPRRPTNLVGPFPQPIVPTPPPVPPPPPPEAPPPPTAPPPPEKASPLRRAIGKLMWWRK